MEESTSFAIGIVSYDYRYKNTPIAPPRPLKLLRVLTLDDRLSALPDSLILHILSFLSMKDAVKTGVLSTRWSYLWTALRTLVFQTPHFMKSEIQKFVTFVDKALLLSSCTNVEKFVLYFTYKRCFASNVNAWIRFAVQNNVEDLELLLHSTSFKREYFRLSLPLYSNSSFKKVRLNNCEVICGCAISWKLLRHLSMEEVKLRDGVISQILSGSPVLEFLKLKEFRIVASLDITSASLKSLVLTTARRAKEGRFLLEISAPNLQSLELSGYFFGIKFQLRNVSSLTSAKLNLSFNFRYLGSVIDKENQDQDQNLIELFESLRHVGDLTIGFLSLEVLSALEVKGVTLSLPSCKCLTLNTRANKEDLLGIALLLQSSPNIETLVVNTVFNESRPTPKPVDFYSLDGETYWVSLKKISRAMLLHLKSVKIIGLMGDEAAFELVEFLLKIARKLKKMEIDAKQGSPFTLSDFTVAMQKLLSFPRSSPDAVVGDGTVGQFHLSKVLSIAEVKGFFPVISSCETLTLHTNIGKFDIPGIERLLLSSPPETLVVDMSSDYHPMSPLCSKILEVDKFNGANYLKKHKKVFDYFQMHLKSVKIIGFREDRSGSVLQLLQFLLENANLLEKMVIKTRSLGREQGSTCSLSHELVRVMQKLLSFRRASSRSVIMIS